MKFSSRDARGAAVMFVVLTTLFLLGPRSSALAIELSPAEVENPRCLTCHGKANIGEMTDEQRRVMVAGAEASATPGPRPGLHVEATVLAGSLHSKVPCVACHVEATSLPHAAKMGPAQCGSCHQQQQQEFNGSVHGMAIAGGSKEAATCRDCHGSHDIISRKNPQSRTFRFNLPFTCAKCHTNQKMLQQEHVRQPLAAQQYIDSMHGRALLVSGLIVAPTCNDCHGVHNILPASDPRSSVNKSNVPHTCGVCHIGVAETYRNSIHGQLVEKGGQPGAGLRDMPYGS